MAEIRIIEKSERVVSEMEKIEEEFHVAYEKARKDDRSSDALDIISIDMFQYMNLSDNPEKQKFGQNKLYLK